MENKKERIVAAIKNGTVIDHIPAAKTYQVASLLGLFDISNEVTIGINFASNKVGKKGIIKISDKFFSKSRPDEPPKTLDRARQSLAKFGGDTLARFEALVDLFGDPATL